MIRFFYYNLVYNDALSTAIHEWDRGFKDQKLGTIADIFFSVDRDNIFFQKRLIFLIIPTYRSNDNGGRII
jgi:hypothetical protein